MAAVRRPYSRPRRIARWAVWATFAVVLFVRYVLMPPDPDQRVFDRGDRDGDWRRRRPPTVVRPPIGKVPDDLPRLHIEIPAKDVETLRNYTWNRHGHQDDRPKVRATVREGNRVYTDVDVNLKGAAGSFRSFDDKPALTLNFSKHVRGQKFRGYSKISLNNSVQDETYLCEVISRELFDAAGVPVPRASHATVLINGRDLGLYVMVEGYNKDFLKRYFKQVDGNLYDGGFCQEIHTNLDLNSGDFPDDHAELERLITAASESDRDAKWARLSEILDVDRFVAMMAMEILTCHWDGYSLNRNNYRVFHNLEARKLIFMPHGMDQMFGKFRSSPQSSIFPDMQGSVARAVVSTSQGRERYFEILGNLYTNIFKADQITNRVHELAARIRPTLAAYHPDVATAHDHNVAYLCDRIVQRSHSVAEQLSHSWDPLTFDEKGAAELTDWSARASGPASSALSFEDHSNSSPAVLHLKSASDRAVGSWRTTALLETGSYRFEGRAKASKTSGDGGAWLRISGSQEGSRFIETNDWAPLSVTFLVREPLRQIELICELREARGEAWFDKQSLRLVRE